MVDTPKPKAAVKAAFIDRGVVIATMLADVGFLTIWAGTTWFVNTYILAKLPLEEGVDQFTLQAFQWMFAVSTFIPVACYTLVDVYKVIRGAWSQIRKG